MEKMTMKQIRKIARNEGVSDNRFEIICCLAEIHYRLELVWKEEGFETFSTISEWVEERTKEIHKEILEGE